MAKNKLDFFIESIKTLKKSGTLTQSGPHLCKAMASHVKPHHKTIVELGAGDGAITKYILDAMSPDARLLAFEINDVHFEKLIEFEDPRLTPICESAQDLVAVLKSYDSDTADIIISAIPFLVLPTEITMEIIDQCVKALKPGSLFIQFHYANSLKPLYEAKFSKVETNFVLLNAPPATVFKCTK